MIYYRPENHIIFLYSRLPHYFYKCVATFTKKYHFKATIFATAASGLAPFEHEYDFDIEILPEEQYSAKLLLSKVRAFDPKAIFISGWNNPNYLSVARKLKGNIPIICGIDNPWKNTFKQRLAGIIGPCIKPFLFDYAWVAGRAQCELARHIGFEKEKIRTGLYSADLGIFEKSFAERQKEKYPHTLLYAGRFLNWKGVNELYETFKSLSESGKISDWQLRMVGRGPLREQLPPTKNIHIQDFVQPEELSGLAASAGAFVLPSWEEHWGVVVHEFAAAGLPLLLSDQVTSGHQFLRPGENGFLFEARNKNDLKAKLVQLLNTPDSQLIQMGQRSQVLAQSNSPEKWADQLMSLIERT